MEKDRHTSQYTADAAERSMRPNDYAEKFKIEIRVKRY